MLLKSIAKESNTLIEFEFHNEDNETTMFLLLTFSIGYSRWDI